jgi:biopolymer transport protein ExbD
MRLPLVALIDVVMFLLFYFIIAGSLAPEEKDLSATLGKDASRGAGSLQAQVLRVGAGASGGAQFQIGSRSVKETRTLERLLAQLPKGPGILIRVSDRAPVQAAADAVQAARDAGFDRITYLPE